MDLSAPAMRKVDDRGKTKKTGSKEGNKDGNSGHNIVASRPQTATDCNAATHGKRINNRTWSQVSNSS